MDVHRGDRSLKNRNSAISNERCEIISDFYGFTTLHFYHSTGRGWGGDGVHSPTTFDAARNDTSSNHVPELHPGQLHFTSSNGQRSHANLPPPRRAGKSNESIDLNNKMVLISHLGTCIERPNVTALQKDDMPRPLFDANTAWCACSLGTLYPTYLRTNHGQPIWIRFPTRYVRPYLTLFVHPMAQYFHFHR